MFCYIVRLTLRIVVAKHYNSNVKTISIVLFSHAIYAFVCMMARVCVFVWVERQQVLIRQGRCSAALSVKIKVATRRCHEPRASGLERSTIIYKRPVNTRGAVRTIAQ